MSFDELGLNPEILRAVAEQGYREPTPIQQQAIPAVLQGRDLMASAQTGTGKTAGFTLPLLQHLVDNEPHSKARRPVRALILTPTRELAAQVGENVREYSKYLNIRSLVVFGGVSINPQMLKLRGGVDVLVATPGRLLDLEHQNALKLDSVEILVLDEPTAGLDPKGRETILSLICDYRRQTGSTVILVSHNMDDVAKYATKALVMNRGKNAMCGTVEEVFSQGETLLSMGLDVPAVTKIFLALKEKGVPVRTDIYTNEQGKAEMLRLLRKEGRA